MEERLARDRRLNERWQVMSARLRAALEDAIPLSAGLRREVAALSERYRGGKAVVLSSRAAAQAYAAWRMPATVAAAGAALRAAATAAPAFRPRSMLDAGCGPGSAAWAARAVWPDLEQVTGIDRSDAVLELASALGSRSGEAVLARARWLSGSLQAFTAPSADVVSAAYLLGELSDEERTGFVHRLWDLATGMLVLVEPGTPAGFARIRAARAELVGAGATIAAPCPHDAACPMAGEDWCRFAVRLARSRLHRQAKRAQLPYEDEPFSYVAATRLPTDRGARVIARPAAGKGAIGLHLCTVRGLEDRRVSRRDGAAYRAARRASWGSALDDPGV
jgi:ribosomal protein RSM22 (predicted rRNA methylase)